MRLTMLPLLLLTACAHAYRAPCEYESHVRLTENASEECHKFKIRDHKGNRINNTADVNGCYVKGKIVSNGTRSNIGHENGHQIEKSCPQWAEGYFD